MSFLAINWPWNFNLPITNTHFNFSFFLTVGAFRLQFMSWHFNLWRKFPLHPIFCPFHGNKHYPPPPETFFQSLNLTHHDMSKFKLLASQTLQRLSGIFLKFFIETPLAYFFWRNLESEIEIKSSATKLLFLAIGLEIKCSIHPQILTFNHKNSCSATKLPTSLFFCSVGTFLLHFTLWPYVS